MLCATCNTAKGEKRPYELLSRAQIEGVDMVLENLWLEIRADSGLWKRLKKWCDIDLLALAAIESQWKADQETSLSSS